MRRIVTIPAPFEAFPSIRDLDDTSPIRPLDLLVSEGVGLTAHTLGRIRRDVHSGPVCAADMRQAFEAYLMGYVSTVDMKTRVAEILDEHGFNRPHVCTPVR